MTPIEQRADSLDEFTYWCEQQRARVAEDLRRSLSRARRARHPAPDDPWAHIVVTKRGYTVSAGGTVRREFQDQVSL